ncbi:peptide chain release factor N(5)-glutamine methyltransferase [Calditrichota bacterium]
MQLEPPPFSSSNSVDQVLRLSEQRLSDTTCLRPRRHAELLLQAVLETDRTSLYLNARKELTTLQLVQHECLLQRRLDGEPIQHVVGWAPFYGRQFKVGSGVFIPRFDTEFIIEHLLQRIDNSGLSRNHPFSILDLCCGCGVLGLTAALELQSAHVTLIDLSPKAIEYTTINADAFDLTSRIKLIKADTFQWLADRDDSFDFILSNPPYIPAVEVPTLHNDVKFGEPQDALTDMGDGLSFYRQWATGLKPALNPGGSVFLEIGDRQAESVNNIFQAHTSGIRLYEDLNEILRVIEINYD